MIATRSTDPIRELETEATECGFDRGWTHAAFIDAYGGDPHAEPEVPPWFVTAATYYSAAYAEGVHAYLTDQD